MRIAAALASLLTAFGVWLVTWWLFDPARASLTSAVVTVMEQPALARPSGRYECTIWRC